MERCASFSGSVDVNTCFQKKPEDRGRWKLNEWTGGNSLLLLHREEMTSSLAFCVIFTHWRAYNTHRLVEFTHTHTHTHQVESETLICRNAGWNFSGALGMPGIRMGSVSVTAVGNTHTHTHTHTHRHVITLQTKNESHCTNVKCENYLQILFYFLELCHYFQEN